MPNIYIVSGANYGDEGKGLVTNYFSDKNTIVVLSSNSCQRAHTVIHNGIRHIFRHFGSGTLKGAVTYITDSFLINPAMFRQEYENLLNLGIRPKVYYNPKCIIATPYDMLCNQIVENARGSNSHSSCGCGAWETIVRRDKYVKTGGEKLDLTLVDPNKFVNKIIKKIEEYYTQNRFICFSKQPESMLDFATNITKENLADDVRFFIENCIAVNSIEQEKELLNSFNTVIFENSQGLLLDPDYNSDIDRTTPANVGAYYPNKIISRNFNLDEIEVNNMYVTRTYFTRHGKGEIGTFGECRKESINPKMLDKTNVPNQWQGTLRYGHLTKIDTDLMLTRIRKDNNIFNSSKIKSNICLVVTHVNEHNNESLINTIRQNLDIILYLSKDEIFIHKELKDE